MVIRFPQKRALVCGSTQGIGKAAALAFAQAGAHVTLLARNADKLTDILKSLPNIQGQHHQVLVADQSDPVELERTVKTWLAEGNHADILINNSGGPPGGPITEASPASFIAAYQQHLLANHVLTTALLPGMKARHHGRIINVISTSVKIPLRNLGVSNTTRGAVASWAKTMANELAIFGITVNNVLPGATRTDRLHSLIDQKSQKSGLPIEEVEREMIQEIPAGRFGRAEEIANAILFLASDQAAYITGVSLPVDGGRTGTI